MPKIITICTQCGKNLRLEDQYIDKNIRCPLCNGVFQGDTNCTAGRQESTLPEALATRSEPAKPTSIRPATDFQSTVGRKAHQETDFARAPLCQ